MPPFAGRAMPPFFGFFRKLTVRNSLKIMGRQKGPNIPWEDKPTRSHPQADQEQRVAVRRPPIFIPMGMKIGGRRTATRCSWSACGCERVGLSSHGMFGPFWRPIIFKELRTVNFRKNPKNGGIALPANGGIQANTKRSGQNHQPLAGLSQIWGGAAPVEGCRRPVKQAVHFNRVLGLS